MTVRVRAIEPERLQLQAGGTLNPRRHLYIERPDDITLLQQLAEGQYVNVLTSRQMGKSSLMVRTAEALIERGVRCAIVDLAAELGTPEDATVYFLGLLNKIARDLRIPVDLKAWWAERTDETMNQRLMRFFREVVLEQVSGPVVCFLDEIDSTLKLPWTDDLFTALRGMHNERPLVPAYERLTFCLIGVAWPNELIKDRRTTPYNVGRTLELRDFDLERDDLTPLASAVGADPAAGRALVERVLHWTGGHPYLTARLCASLQEIGARSPEDVDRRVDDAFRTLERVSGDVHFQQVLRFLETRLADGLATFTLYERILKGARERDQTTLAHTELKLSGLVKRNEDGCLVVRNRIYERLFDRRWVESTKPRRTLRTYRRYAITAGIALLIGALVAGGWITYLQTQLNERQQLEALGVSITSTEYSDGTRIGFLGGASQEVFEQAVPLLEAVGPVTELDLSRTQVADLAPLGNLTNLQWLDLSRTQVADAAPLANLTNLQELNLSGTQVADAAPLAGLTNLQSLDLSDTQVADAAPLAGLTNLQSLDLSGTRVADAAPLAKLENLQELDLTGTLVDDIPALGQLTNLRILYLIRTPISNLDSIKNLISLEELDIAGTKIKDLSSLTHMSNLKYLGIGGGDFKITHRYDFGLTGMQKYEYIRDRGPAAPIETFDLLARFSELRSLDLYDTNLSDLTPIESLQKLNDLSLGSTQVKDISSLSSLQAIKYLNLGETDLSDLDPLAALTDLRILDLRGTQVRDVTPLGNLTKLELLFLGDTQVQDVAPLANLTNLQLLDLSGTQVSQDEVAELRRALAERANRPVQIRGP